MPRGSSRVRKTSRSPRSARTSLAVLRLQRRHRVVRRRGRGGRARPPGRRGHPRTGRSGARPPWRQRYAAARTGPAAAGRPGGRRALPFTSLPMLCRRPGCTLVLGRRPAFPRRVPEVTGGGSRDRHRQERPAGVRVRRHRDRAVAPHPRPRGRLDQLGHRRVLLPAAAARERDGRGRLAPHGDRDRAPGRPRRAQPRGPVDPLRGPEPAAGRDRRAATTPPRPSGCRRSTASRSSPS